MFNALDHPLQLAIALLLVAIPCVLLLRGRMNYLKLPKLRPIPARMPPPDCMVVIPARNEKDSIARAVKSFPPDTVIVVDDASDDGTAAEARKAGAGAMKARPLLRAVIGKANACQTGAEALTCRWVLFTDADTWYERSFMQSLVECAEASDLDFLSVHMTPTPQGFVENLIAPYVVALFFSAINPKTWPKAAFNGQCILVRREAYEFVGGHGSLVKTMSDDLRMAALAERHRMKFAVVRSGRLGHMRFHADGVAEGIRRNAARFMDMSSWIGFTLMLTASTAALWAPAVAWLWLIDEKIPAIAAAVLPLVCLAPWYGPRFLLAPIAIYATLPLLYRGMLSAIFGGRLEWKGRTI